MSIFDSIRSLKSQNKFEEAWRLGIEAYKNDSNNSFLQCSLFWIIFAAIKNIKERIMIRKAHEPFTHEKRMIELWVERITILHLSLPNENIDFRLWNLFIRDAQLGKFSSAFCNFILANGSALFSEKDYEPYKTENGESPSVVCKIAKIVSENYILYKKTPLAKVISLINHAIAKTKDKDNKIWLVYCQGKVLYESAMLAEGREKFMHVLNKKRSEAWAWVALADTYVDEPEKALSVICKALCCRTEPKYLVGAYLRLANIFLLLENNKYASMAFRRLRDIYNENNWKLNEDHQVLLQDERIQQDIDPKGLDPIVREYAQDAVEYSINNPRKYIGIIMNIHQSGKGANIYINKDLVLVARRDCFPAKRILSVGTFVEVICDYLEPDIIPVSVKESFPQYSNSIIKFSGKIRLYEKGFGFVNEIFIPPYLASKKNEGEEVNGIAVLKSKNDKSSQGFSAIIVNS